MRVLGWERLLYSELEKVRNAEYNIGRHDCALFAIKVVQAVTGQDYGKRVRGKYKTKAGSERLIRTLGGSKLREAVSAVLKREPVAVRQAMRGDPVLYIDEDIEHLGICVGAEAAVLREEGLGFVSLSKCTCAWKT